MPRRPVLSRPSPWWLLLLALGAASWILVPRAVAAPAPPAPPDASWLDQPLTPWNQPGMAIPTAPTSTALINPRCLELARWAESPEDQALVDAGWNLYQPYQSGWGLVAVPAAVTLDGMCRPVQYQTFIFADGVFAGTISPVPMDARATGAGTLTRLSRDTLSARYLRYAPTDALCCPTLGAVDVDFEVQRTPQGPVVVQTHAFTEPGAGQ